MLKPSIMRKKSKVNGQIVLNIKESKKNPKISFKDALNILQLKLLTKEINQNSNTANFNANSSNHSKNYNSQYLHTSVNSIYPNNKYSTKQNLINIEEINNNENLSSRRHSARMNMGKNYSDNFSIKKKFQGGLDIINEIVLTEQKEKDKKNLRKYQLKNGRNKNKNNLLDELEKFDREQQLKMDKYLDEKRRNKIDLMFNKNKIFNSKDIGLHKNKQNRNEKIESKGNEINKTITEEKTNEDEQSLSNIDIYKNNKIKDNSNKENEDINKVNDNEKNDFQEIKHKYFSQNIFTTKFPNTEYKFKYLNNFFEDKSESNKLLGNYQDEKNEKKETDIRNFSNPINKNLSNDKQIIRLNRYDSFNIKQKNGSNISPKILFKNSNDTDLTKSLIDSNRNYNIDQSSNSNNYAMISNRILNEEKNNNEINDMYKVILNSIDNKLYKRNKDKNRNNLTVGSNSRLLSSSNEKIWIAPKKNKKKYNNYFRELFSNNRNNYYKDICHKYDKYNDLSIEKRHLKKYRIQNTYTNRNYLREINKIFNE